MTLATHPYGFEAFLPTPAIHLSLPLLILLGDNEGNKTTKKPTVEVIVDCSAILRVEPLVHVIGDLEIPVVGDVKPT
jgi:hypothetical protein